MPRTRWIITADERMARLVRVDPAAPDRLHVTLEDEIQTSWQDKEHGRPSPLKGKSGHTYASWGHEDEVRRERFAKEIAVWLERQAEELHIERIAVFAAPQFLGALREAWSPRLALRIEEHHGDLTHVPPGDLAHHASVTDLVADASG